MRQSSNPYLRDFAQEKRLYLDHQARPRRSRKGKRVTWTDPYGNLHDLDYVLERDGSEEATGTPVAFIEVAWRLYARHSRNKAQEIQGAILPLAEKFQWSNPFLGVVLAGVFTDGSLDQLRSLGFQVLYFPYETLVNAFAAEGIDIAFDETTPDAIFRACVEEIETASPDRMGRIKGHLVRANQAETDRFMSSLADRLSRMVERVVIIPLYGRTNEFATIEEAANFLSHHPIYEGSGDFRRYEILVTFTNGDRVEGSFQQKEKAREFLRFVAQQ